MQGNHVVHPAKRALVLRVSEENVLVVSIDHRLSPSSLLRPSAVSDAHMQVSDHVDLCPLFFLIFFSWCLFMEMASSLVM